MKSTINTSSVDKAFILLEYLVSAGRPVSLQEVTSNVDLPKPTAYRLLRVLQDMGYVSRPSQSRHYLVGPRTARLATADPFAALKAHAQPLLRKLYEEFQETVNLGTLSSGQVLYLDYIETSNPLRFVVTPGQSDPYFTTALGRAIVAQMPDDQIDRLIAETRLRPVTPHSVKTQEELRQSIAKTRMAGYAEETEEAVLGISCMAASLAPLGFPQAAISIAVPMCRLSLKLKGQITKALKTIC